MMTTIGGVQYREVKRKAKVGEKIKVVAATISGGRYVDGHVLTVREAVSSGVYITENSAGLYHREYVVLEPVTSADTIVHDGQQYRKVDRPVREGDVVLALVDEVDLVAGKAYKVSRLSSSGGVHVIDDAQDSHYLYVDEYSVLEPIAPSLVTLETELAATKAKVAEMEAQLAEVKRKEAEAQRLKVGEYAKVVGNDAGHSAKIGDIVKIAEDDRASTPFRCDALGGEELTRPWFREIDLVRATEDERKKAEEAKWSAIGRKVGEFKDGDVVRVINGEGSRVPTGEIGIIAEIDRYNVMFRVNTATIKSENWQNRWDIELIAPVESVVNLRGGDAA
ncbi:hypothetical protein [Brevibacillus brevis]|uniref:hypothetical protein n=1 Tax=Brevibacillus brevis TaxID=1393 RepID=UPI00165E033A|nr:hypothetical protein [Brevibacillus brevis]